MECHCDDDDKTRWLSLRTYELTRPLRRIHLTERAGGDDINSEIGEHTNTVSCDLKSKQCPNSFQIRTDSSGPECSGILDPLLPLAAP